MDGAAVLLGILGVAGILYGLYGVAGSLFGSILASAGKADESMVAVSFVISLMIIGAGVFVLFAAFWGGTLVTTAFWIIGATVALTVAVTLFINSQRSSYSRGINTIIAILLAGAAGGIVFYLLSTYAGGQ